MISKENLDKRICDVEGVENTQTYREFIMESEDAFGLEHEDLDEMNEYELVDYLEYLDYLWEK